MPLKLILPLLLVLCLLPDLRAQPGEMWQGNRDEKRTSAVVETPVPTPTGGNPFVTNAPFKARNRIDRLLRESLRRQNVDPAPLCSDEVFIRRAYLDVIGMLPTVSEVYGFLEDKDENKRRKLIETLLARQEFVDFQTMRWCDLLRVKAEFPINLWPNGAACYYRWIRKSVDENKPYDRFVRDLLTASGSNFRDGPSNFYRAVPSKDAETLAETVTRTFLGIDINPWPKEKRTQLARFFSQVGYKETAQWKEEIVYWERKSFDSHVAIFPDGQQTTLESDRDPRRVFADWLVSPDNVQFNRCIANRVWVWLFGSGLIPEPEDSRANLPPVHPELLDYLCSELVKSKYDLRHLYRLILNSSVYQQSSIPKDTHVEAAVLFASYPIRRIEAEVLQDNLMQLFDLPIGYVSEIPEPFTYIPPRYRTVLLPDSGITSSFLDMFGRASRDTGTESDRNNSVTESQLLFFLNSTEVNTWISRYMMKYRNFQRRPGAYKNMLDELWLTFLSRYPTETERRIVADELREPDKQGRQKLQDVIWSLLNTTEFLCKH